LCSATTLSKYGKDRVAVVITVNPDAERWRNNLLVEEERSERQEINTATLSAATR
jgi:hypothetical protein